MESTLFWNKSSCCCSDNPAFSLVCKLPILKNIRTRNTDIEKDLETILNGSMTKTQLDKSLMGQ